MKKSSLWKTSGFTLVELLTVMLIILLLAGLVLGTVGFAQKKAARARAESEIQALSLAIENYKSDNGTYPRGEATGSVPADTTDAATDKIDARTNGNPTNYKSASLALYTLLSGDLAHNGKFSPDRTNYMSKGFKDDIYGRISQSTPIQTGATTEVAYLSDPFGGSYGYSTANSHYFLKTPTAAPADAPGYNPSFDLWSTGGTTATTTPAATDTAAIAKMQAGWVKNW